MSAVSAAPQVSSFQDEMVLLIKQQITATALDLTGLTVITEAATGAYAATAVIAAQAGAATVYALARDTTNHGSAADAARETLSLAERFGVADRIRVVDHIGPAMLAGCNILTNCGHLRPITEAQIRQLPGDAVIALMFEAWEFRDTDLDLEACRALGIRVAAVNERHPAVDVFSFLGPLCVRLLSNSGTPVRGKHIALLCDNPFASFIAAGLVTAGASCMVLPNAAAIAAADWDVVVVALTPTTGYRLTRSDFLHLAQVVPQALIAQFWGDIDRGAARKWGFSVWPPEAPHPGHMAILLNALGPEPIVRLQTGGLRAAELAVRNAEQSPTGILQLL